MRQQVDVRFCGRTGLDVDVFSSRSDKTQRPIETMCRLACISHSIATKTIA